MRRSAEIRGAARPRIDLRLVAILLLLPLTFLASRSCGQDRHNISQAEAVAIAKRQVTYRPDGDNVRFVRRGIPSVAYWAVSLWQRDPDGGRRNVTIVVIDAQSGRVTQLNRNASP